MQVADRAHMEDLYFTASEHEYTSEYECSDNESECSDNESVNWEPAFGSAKVANRAW